MKEHKKIAWEERMMELMMSKAFDELSSEDQDWVKQYQPREDYDHQHSLIQQLNEQENWDLPEESRLNTLLPLPKDSKRSWYQRSIPVYHLGWFAAASLLFFFLWMTPTETNDFAQSEYMTQAQVDTVYKNDTVWMEKLVYDTVVEVEERIQYVKEVEYQAAVDCQKEPPRLLEASHSPVIVSGLESARLESTGQSLKSDPTATLINDYLNAAHSPKN